VGHGSSGESGVWEGWGEGAGDVMRAFDANVAGRSSTDVSVVVGFVVAAGAKGLEVDANGLLEPEVDPNGLEDDAEEAKGFPLPPD